MRPSGYSDKTLFLFFVALALALRLPALSFGLPGLYHADEPMVVHHALAFGSGDLNPHFFKIPPLLSYGLFGVYGLCFLLGKGAGLFHGTADFESLFYRDPSFFFWIARFFFGALAGSLSAGFFYHGVRRQAVLAALFFAVSFLPVSDSHYIYADIPLLAVLLGAFGVLFRLADGKDGLKTHVLCGALIGLAAAVKYNGIILIFPYGYLALAGRNNRWKGIGAAAAVSAVVFSVFCPWWFLDREFFFRELLAQSRSNNGMTFGHMLRYSLAGSVGWPVLIAASWGLICWRDPQPAAAAERKRTALLLWLVVYGLVLVKAGQPYPRYVLPLLPAVFFFAARGLERLAGVFKIRSGFLILGLAGLIVLPSLTKSLLWLNLMRQPDVRDMAADWVETHLPQGTAVALDWDFYMPRLAWTRESLQEKKNEIAGKPFEKTQLRRLDALWAQSDRRIGYRIFFMSSEPESERFLFARPVVPYALESLKRAGVRYAMVLPGFPNEHAGAFYKELSEEARLLVRFSPYRDGRRVEPYDRTPMTGGPFTWQEIIHRARNGYAIDLYEIVP